jgi:predicted ferric reductase
LRVILRTSLAGLYLAVVFVPLVLALGADRPNGASAAYEVSLATGLVGLSLLVIAYVLPKRIRSFSSGLGIDVVLSVHRLVGLSALAFVLTHVAAVLATDRRNVRLVEWVSAPNRARAAMAATAALLLIVGSSVWRRYVFERYERWRKVHVLLAISALTLTGLHVYWLRHLIVQKVFRYWFGLLLAVVVVASIRRWIWRPLRALTHPYEVAEVRRESPSVSTLVLRAVGHRGFRYRAGQFAWIRVGRTPFGFEEHPFTIASSPTLPGLLEFTIKNLGDFSGDLAFLAEGDRVWVDGPHGAFTPDRGRSRGLAFIAGGVGITPMISTLRTLARRGDPREHILFVGAAQADELLFRTEIAEIAARIPLKVVELLYVPTQGWGGPVGSLTPEVLAAHLPKHRAELDYYICGPPRLVTAAEAALRVLQIPPRRVHTEKFDFV